MNQRSESPVAGAGHRRVLALMIKAPRAGHVKSRLAVRYSPDGAVSIYRCMLEDTVEVACALREVDVAAVCPEADAAALVAWLGDRVSVVRQEGKGLAAGLAFVFRHFCSAGYDRIVAYNGDTPHLPPRVLETAFALLAGHDLVVGPTLDGGYYLVGASAPHPTLFDRAPLGTESALSALAGRAQALGLSLARTAPCYDIDVPEDLERLRRDLHDGSARAPRTAALLAGWITPDSAVPRSTEEPAV